MIWSFYLTIYIYFYNRTDYDCYLYGVFDGHDGSKAAHFAAERIPAELLLGQLSPDSNDGDVKKALEQAFQIVEHGFFESIDVELAKKTHLQSQVVIYNAYIHYFSGLPCCWAKDEAKLLFQQFYWNNISNHFFAWKRLFYKPEV